VVASNRRGIEQLNGFAILSSRVRFLSLNDGGPSARHHSPTAHLQPPSRPTMNVGVHEAGKTRHETWPELNRGSGASALDSNFVMPKAGARVRRLLTSVAAPAHLGRERSLSIQNGVRSGLAQGSVGCDGRARGSLFPNEITRAWPSCETRRQPPFGDKSRDLGEPLPLVVDLRHREKRAFNTSVYAS
jgi:hypothetical protein